MVNNEITINHLNKNVTLYYNEMLSYEGEVVSINEQEYDNGETISLIHVTDDNHDSYEVLLYKNAVDFFEEDWVRFWGCASWPI